MRGNHLRVCDAAWSGGSIPARAGKPTTPSRKRRRKGVYPRACGETRRSIGKSRKGRGLSPRVRGNRRITEPRHVFGGSIPARAGKPRPGPLPRRFRKVYPRACGETFDECHATGDGQGLSPRVRGNPGRPGARTGRHGSIPARAGKPSFPAPPPGRSWVYPRACGETWGLHGHNLPGEGLSPRVRGNQACLVGNSVISGSIPARAGKPRHAKKSCRRAGVYPRACGETFAFASASVTASGLSPRVRGNLERDDAGRQGRGSIPARAGKPPAGTKSSRARWVYPRACGETKAVTPKTWWRMGLSPRVRGNRSRRCRRSCRRWSIPARAGKPTTASRSTTRIGVYPRACGETVRLRIDMLNDKGLSPRVRGNLRVSITDLLPDGSIPARAGKPPRPGPRKSWSWVYPRACGETFGAGPRSAPRPGLSPRVRGNQLSVVRVSDGNLVESARTS